jgi:DNA-binding NtrC family response regulator
VPGGFEETIGVLALVNREDLPETEPAAPSRGESEAEWLHERIRRFRHGAAACLRLDQLLGDSPAMKRARAQVALAAESSASVLIVGPPGSGRQRVAGTIHYGVIGQPAGTFIPLACSVLGADLIGSAVRAVAEQRFEGDQPTSGTLVLNDVDLVPVEVQGEMAATLGSRSFPLRLIGTAREPLEEWAQRDQYHRDLAAALSTIVIRLPPLSQRREDIPLLAQAFVEEINSRSTKQVAGFTPEALDYLDSYNWPGNVDELAQIVAEAHERTEGPLVGVGDLPRRIHLARQASAHPQRVEDKIVLDEFLARIERELIERALARAKGNKSKAAKLLGMTRPRLYRRLVQLGLEAGG